MEVGVGNRTLSLELPDELIALLGSEEAAAAKAKEALVLELLREARISQGKAARLLGLTRWDTLDLMVDGSARYSSRPRDRGARATRDRGRASLPR